MGFVKASILLFAFAAAPVWADSLVDTEVATLETWEGPATIDPAQVDASEPKSSSDASAIDLLIVLNRGDYGWEILRQSRSVLGNQFHFANALPLAARSERSLGDWGPRQNRSFIMSARNLLGQELFLLDFQLGYRVGGKLDGRGNYIGSVSVIASDFTSWWGVSVDFRVCSVVVSGSDETGEPVADMGVKLCLKVATPISSQEMSQIFVINGSTPDVRVLPAVFYDRVQR